MRVDETFGLGRQIVARVPIHRINYVASAVFASLAVWSIIELF